ncbi:MAG: hypothetical protein ACTSUL_07310 [Promethearchaeota archaeon]
MLLLLIVVIEKSNYNDDKNIELLPFLIIYIIVLDNSMEFNRRFLVNIHFFPRFPKKSLAKELEL